MTPTLRITRTTVLGCGVASVALGVAVASVAFFSRVRAQPQDAEAIAEELRANGAIVESYYKVLGSSYYPASQQSTPVWLGGYMAAGVLVAAGWMLILKAPSFPLNRQSPNRNQVAATS